MSIYLSRKIVSFILVARQARMCDYTARYVSSEVISESLSSDCHAHPAFFFFLVAHRSSNYLSVTSITIKKRMDLADKDLARPRKGRP